MTITVANINITTDNFGQWVTKTNQIADALSNYVVTTDSTDTPGNAAITGTFTSDVLRANTISGYAGGASKNLVATSNVVFAANAFFAGLRVNLGLAGNVVINSGNSTHRVLTVNSAAGNTLSASKLTLTDIDSFAVGTPANNDILFYSTYTNKWVASNTVNLNSVVTNSLITTTVSSLSGSLVANTTQVTVITPFLANSVGTSGVTANASGNYPYSNTQGFELGLAAKRWSLFATNADISGNLVANNVVINGSLSGAGMALTSLNVTTNNVTLGTAFYLVANGNVGLANTTPSNKLHVEGTGRFTSLGVGTNASGTTGEIRATNDITAYFSSDRNLKTNIVTIQDALQKVNKLNGVEFDWTDQYIEKHGGEDGYFVRKHDVGVIAQEVQEVIPEVVGVRENGTLAVKYDKLVALLIEAVKDLSKQVEELKNK